MSGLFSSSLYFQRALSGGIVPCRSLSLSGGVSDACVTQPCKEGQPPTRRENAEMAFQPAESPAPQWTRTRPCAKPPLPGSVSLPGCWWQEQGTCSDAKKESRQTRSYQDWPSLSALGSADEMRRAGLPVLLAARRQRRRTHLRADIRICRLWACRKASAQKGDRGTVRAGRSCSLPQARPGRSCKAAARRAGSPDGSLLVPKKKLPYRALSRRLSGAGPFADCL